MPWQEVSIMSLRHEFVQLALQEGVNMRELCRRYPISPTTGYKWVARYREAGVAGLEDRSRRPRHAPGRTAPEQEALVREARTRWPQWGPRKLRRWLHTQGHPDLPSPSTIAAILRRHGCIGPADSASHHAWQRFEAPAPNALWQMDFKGHVPTLTGRCHPLTLLDDHSRYCLGLIACGDEQTETVQAHLTTCFRRYGLPARMLMDNGSPWGDRGGQPYTRLTVWLLRLGIGVSHGRPYHPQTQGKAERFHGTLVRELLHHRLFLDLPACQQAFDPWRHTYNHERPHDALNLAVPADRYRPSPRSFPNDLPPITYDPTDQVRTVQAKGEISFRGREWHVGRAFHRQPVALRPTDTDGRWQVFFCEHPITELDLRTPRSEY